MESLMCLQSYRLGNSAAPEDQKKAVTQAEDDIRPPIELSDDRKVSGRHLQHDQIIGHRS